jgi:hypothetical protein
MENLSPHLIPTTLSIRHNNNSTKLSLIKKTVILNEMKKPVNQKNPLSQNKSRILSNNPSKTKYLKTIKLPKIALSKSRSKTNDDSIQQIKKIKKRSILSKIRSTNESKTSNHLSKISLIVMETKSMTRL